MRPHSIRELQLMTVLLNMWNRGAGFGGRAFDLWRAASWSFFQILAHMVSQRFTCSIRGRTHFRLLRLLFYLLMDYITRVIIAVSPVQSTTPNYF